MFRANAPTGGVHQHSQREKLLALLSPPFPPIIEYEERLTVLSGQKDLPALFHGQIGAEKAAVPVGVVLLIKN